MTDINKPIQPIQPSDDGWKRVQRIEGYKQKGKQDPLQENTSNALLVILFASAFKKLLSYTKKKNAQLTNIKAIAKDLSAFQAALQTLTNKDCSRDPSFTQLLVQLWHTLEQDCNQLTEDLGGDNPISVKFNFLLDEINRFPPWEEHSLGYYLTKRAGDTWLPVPFMDILLTLHLSCKNSPLQNPLETWCHLINDIIDTL